MRIVLSLLISLLSLIAYNQKIQVGIYNNYRVSSMTFSVVSGTYQLSDSVQTLDTLKPSDIYFVSFGSHQITLTSLSGKTFANSSFQLNGTDSNNVFQLKAINPSIASRSYDDDVHLSIAFGRMQLTNHVEMDKYIAGVVEAESGAYAEKEFYKAQALLCRTYALKNIVRHGGESFNLCDDVHCQAYKGRNRYNPNILAATQETHNLIVTDTDSNFITAAFHANSGGETCTADHVWIGAPDYLHAVKDPYSLKGRGAKWTKEIEVVEWRDFLLENGFKVSGKKAHYFEREQPTRQKYYQLGNDKLLYSKLRTHFKLKSAYFSVTRKNNHTLLLNGNGYGHGIGMSQEGAMEMAKQGFTYKDIVHFYFQHVLIINL